MATEKRLIDAYKPEELLRSNSGRYHHKDDIIAAIAGQPTVDAVEVVHGRWIFKHNPITDPKRYFIRIVCSECDLHTGQVSNYCPNCGAKMDGGNEDGC